MMREDGPGVGEYVVDREGLALSRGTLERMANVVRNLDGPDPGVGHWCVGACK
jgi:hypothetical protein